MSKIIDYQSGVDEVKSKYAAIQTGAQSLKDEAELKRKELKDNLEKDKKEITSTIDKFKEQKKRYQKEVKTQIDNMLDMIQMNSWSNKTSKYSTVNYIKKKFIQTAVVIKPKIFEILEQETIRALGCSQQQSYAPQTIFLKVKSVDLKRLLTRNPDEGIFTVSYEKLQPTANQIPFSISLHKEEYELILSAIYLFFCYGIKLSFDQFLQLKENYFV